MTKPKADWRLLGKHVQQKPNLERLKIWLATKTPEQKRAGRRLANKRRMEQQYFRHKIDFCICCGAKVNLTADHILSDAGLRRNKSSTPYARLRDEPQGNLQGLCFPCNDSKNDGTTCGIHNKYLGLWNYLPRLDNIEQSLWELQEDWQKSVL